MPAKTERVRNIIKTGRNYEFLVKVEVLEVRCSASIRIWFIRIISGWKRIFFSSGLRFLSGYLTRIKIRVNPGQIRIFFLCNPDDGFHPDRSTIPFISVLLLSAFIHYNFTFISYSSSFIIYILSFIIYHFTIINFYHFAIINFYKLSSSSNTSP